MKTFSVLHIGKDVSSRVRAAELRRQVEASVLSFGRTAIDFWGVRTISDCFADELFGVLINAYGEEWFKTNVEVQNLEPRLKDGIIAAIERRSALL